jgi:hypothetical protein
MHHNFRKGDNHMLELAPPDNKTILKILSPVSFEDRLVGYRVGERSGTSIISLYSFQEVIDFLGNTLPQIDFKSLERWMRMVIGDEELGESISKAVETEPNDYDRTQRIRTVMEKRLAQCKKQAWVDNQKTRG